MLNLTSNSRDLIKQLVNFYNINNIYLKLPDNIHDIDIFLKYLFSKINHYNKINNLYERLNIKKTSLSKKQSIELYKNNRNSYFINNKYIPYNIIKYIDNNIHTLRVYNYNIINNILDYKYNINVYFILFKDSKISVKFMDKTISFIVLAFNIINTLTNNNNNNCSKDKINIYIYFTPIKRIIDNDNYENVLDEKHSNGGFCYGCVQKQNIVIYRREDFYKTLIHELVHNFAVDEPLINNISSKESIKFIKSIFNIDIVTDDNKFNYAINESYTEFWACLIHTSIFSYYNSNKYNEFKTHFLNFINLEIAHSLVQFQKILTINNLQYNNIIYNNSNDNRSNYYKENTHVFSYYILKTLLLYNYIDIINTGIFFSSKFNPNNNINIIFNFKNICLYQKYLKKASINKQFVNIINKIELHLNKYYKKTNIEMYNLLIKNIRMVSIEFI